MNELKTIGSVCIAAAFGCAALAEEPKPVRTQAGMVQGVEANGIAVYKGIPFAAPPVGSLRWRAPEAAPPWSDVRSADKFAPSCTRTEDCLYLNVWTPAKSPNDRLAVMVWIYGGGFALGSTSTGLYDGTNLAKKGVVVVSVAYRLGALGFMTHPQLTAEQGGHSGNYGLLDMIAGLQWVKRNIAAFGGNPNRVTLFGQSAGSVAVSMLAASPLAKGLFQGAISESGGNFGPARQENEPGTSMYSVALGEKTSAAFLARLGVTSIADARQKSADEMLKSSPSALADNFWPIFDGYVLSGDQYKLYEAGKYNDTPVLIGTNSDEGASFVPSAKASDYQNSTRSGFGEYADKILETYPGGSDAEALRSNRDLVRDAGFGWPAWAWARLQSKTGKGKVYVYYFSHRPPYPDAPQYKSWGAGHAAELSYVFGNFTAAIPGIGVLQAPSASDHALSEEMMSYWVNFAKAGDPNGRASPHWPAFTNANAQVMNLNDPSRAISVPNQDKLQVLEGYYAWRRSQAEAKHKNTSEVF
jgi:para-nitrobenzyl esterase